jgi:PadR family transcriptional regulator, regulatory protein PadR
MSDVLGAFEQAVLLTVIRLGAGAYGRGILNDLQERLDRDVAAGAIYATLDRLETKGLATSKVAPGTPQRGGRVRRYYAVTAAGVHALNESRIAMDKMWRGLALPLKGRA